MIIPMLEHSVGYGESMSSTEVQQQSTTLVQQAIPHNHPSPGFSSVTDMGVESLLYNSIRIIESLDGTLTRAPPSDWRGTILSARNHLK